MISDALASSDRLDLRHADQITEAERLAAREATYECWTNRFIQLKISKSSEELDETQSMKRKHLEEIWKALFTEDCQI